jgi:hypothetical protein
MADRDNGVAGKATPVGATEPVEEPALSQLGATFAERKAAREQSEKRVRSEDEGVEDKAVGSAEAKRRTPRKKS